MPEPLNEPWTAERIQEYMRSEHGVNWGPPPVKDTWTESEKRVREMVDAPRRPTQQAVDESGWTVYDPDTKSARPITVDEMFVVAEQVRDNMDSEPDTMHPTAANWSMAPDSTEQILQDIRDHADDVFPRDHAPTDRETEYKQAAMREYQVPAADRALARWADRMEEQQARAASMARHPAGKMIPQQGIRP